MSFEFNHFDSGPNLFVFAVFPLTFFVVHRSVYRLHTACCSISRMSCFITTKWAIKSITTFAPDRKLLLIGKGVKRQIGAEQCSDELVRGVHSPRRGIVIAASAHIRLGLHRTGSTWSTKAIHFICIMPGFTTLMCRTLETRFGSALLAACGAPFSVPKCDDDARKHTILPQTSLSCENRFARGGMVAAAVSLFPLPCNSARFFYSLSSEIVLNRHLALLLTASSHTIA